MHGFFVSLRSQMLAADQWKPMKTSFRPSHSTICNPRMIQRHQNDCMDPEQDAKQEDCQMISLEDTFAFLDTFEFKHDTSEYAASTPDPSVSLASWSSKCRSPDRYEQDKDGVPCTQSYPSLQHRESIHENRRSKPTFKHSRKRKRNEILRLNDQIEALETQLLQLRQRNGHAMKQRAVHEAVLAGVTSDWLGHAALQCKERRVSDGLDLGLNASLRNQMQLSKTLETFFQKESSLEVTRCISALTRLCLDFVSILK